MFLVKRFKCAVRKCWRLLHKICIAVLIAASVGAMVLGVSSLIYPVYDTDSLFNIRLSQSEDSVLSLPRFWMTAESGVARFKLGYERVLDKDGFRGEPVGRAGFEYLSIGMCRFPGSKTEYIYCVCTVSLWILVVLFGFYPLVWLLRGPFRQEVRKYGGQCVHCGCDLHGRQAGDCPKCGRVVQLSSKIVGCGGASYPSKR